MDRTFSPTEWKPQETTGKRWQDGFSVMERVPPSDVLEVELVERSGFSKALSEAAMHSGFDNYQIADKLHMSHGYMCKFMRGVGAQWAKRLIRFMHVTGSLAPLIWMANEMGCDVTVRHALSAELAAARAVIAAHEQRHGRLLG